MDPNHLTALKCVCVGMMIGAALLFGLLVLSMRGVRFGPFK